MHFHCEHESILQYYAVMQHKPKETNVYFKLNDEIFFYLLIFGVSIHKHTKKRKGSEQKNNGKKNCKSVRYINGVKIKKKRCSMLKKL